MDTILDRDTPSSTIETFSDREVFTLIWSKPKAVLTYIKHVDYNKYFVLLVALAGAHRVLTGNYQVFLTAPPLLRLFLKAAMGAVIGWIFYYIISAIWSWVGSWLKGKGNHRDMYTCLIYALLPSIVSLAVLFPIYLVASVGGFDGWATSQAAMIEYFIQIVVLVSGIWSLVNAVTAISVVHEFSIGKAILTLFIPVAVLMLLAGLIGLIVFIL